MASRSLWLILLAPVVAELCSGATPFPTFIRPPIFVTYLGLYGCGALLIREVAARRGLGYVSILLLGAAYGVVEEGILVKAWFDPEWMDAAILARSVRINGVNVLSPFLNIPFHAIVSIASPIAIVEATTDASTDSRRPWLSGGWLAAAGAAYVVAALIVGRTFNADYTIAPRQYALPLVLLVVFVVLALSLREVRLGWGTIRTSPGLVWIVGASWMFVVATIFYRVSAAGVPWWLVLGLALVVYALYAAFYAAIDWYAGGRTLRYAAAAGFVTGLLPFSAGQVIMNERKLPNLIAEVAMVVVLVFVYRRLKLSDGQGQAR